MRELATAGFTFAAGIAAAHWLLPAAWLFPAAVALVLPLLAGIFLLRGLARRRCVIICCFAALGAVWYGVYSGTYSDAAARFDDTVQTVTVRVEEYPYRDGDYASVNVKLAEEGCPRLGIAVSDYSGALPELRPGDLAELELDFSDASTRYGEPTDVYAARGVHLRAYYVNYSGSERDWKSALYFPQELLHLMSGSISGNFPGDVRDIMLALLIGETSGVYDDCELDNALSVTGVSHVISVSGMHLGFLWSAVVALAGKRRAALIGAPLVVVFTLMMGCSSAIVRACVMLLFSMAAPILRRESDAPTSLAFALMLLLAANPMSIASASLQLSFASMLGLVLVSPAIYRRLSERFNRKGAKARKLRAVVITSVSSSLGATVFTAPIVALLFGYVSLVSPLANLLTLWAVSAAFTLGFAAAVVGIVLPFAGAALAWVAAWPARLFVLVVELLARLPYAAVYTADNTVVWWLVFTYALFIAAFLLRKRLPDGRARMRPLIPALCSAAALLAVLASAKLDAGSERSVTVLDVGQGESVALISGGSAAVVDCGGVGSWDDAGDVAGEYMLSRGRRAIDALVLTHLHSDHANGAARLLTRVDVGTLYIPDGTDDSDGELEEILAAAARRGTEVVRVSGEDVEVALPGLDLTLLAPRGVGDENERGLVVLASIGDYDAVITGDAGASVERDLVESGALGRAELLVAGHHGSRSSSSFELVSALLPETVVVSVGYNSYGHPTDEALERLGITGAEVYRTDVNGNVTVRIDEDG